MKAAKFLIEAEKLKIPNISKPVQPCSVHFILIPSRWNQTKTILIIMFPAISSIRLSMSRPITSQLMLAARQSSRRFVPNMMCQTRLYSRVSAGIFIHKPMMINSSYFKGIRFASTKQADAPKPVTVLGSSGRGLSPKEQELAKGLNWEQFLTLRKTQRRMAIGSSIFGAFLAMGLAFVWVAQKQIDPTETIFGLDAFTVYIGAIMCIGVLGYLVGPPLIGDTLFNLSHRGIMGSYRIKQKLFLQHIRKMRVDASRQSMNNPVPDYYGEKIGSLKDYRQWLRDCNEYRRKASEFL